MPRGSNLRSGQPDGARGRQMGASKGGEAVKGLTPPDKCPNCGASMTGRSWHSYLGHLAIEKTSAKYGFTPHEFNLVLIGLYGDPHPENGAFSQHIKRFARDRKLGDLPNDLRKFLVDGDAQATDQ